MAEKDKMHGVENGGEEIESSVTDAETAAGAEDGASKQDGAHTGEACGDGAQACDNETEDELSKAQAAAEDYKRKWYSVAAEYDNYRKRTKEAVSQAFQDGRAEAILKLLPVADTFGYAYDGASDEKTKAGIDKIIKNFNAILLSMGVEEIPVNCGDGFDEGVMEAVMNIPVADGEQAGTVKNVLKKGYRRDGKVIRFAQVSVTV